MVPACLFVLSVCLAICLLGFRACQSTSMTDRAKYVPDPIASLHSAHILSESLLVCRGFLLHAFSL